LPNKEPANASLLSVQARQDLPPPQQLREQAHDVVVFEKDEKIGGLCGMAFRILSLIKAYSIEESNSYG
jgi:hypothetical protein